jgi:anaerobic carbon-monoxide dehydrogenase iron sulfur subunit
LSKTSPKVLVFDPNQCTGCMRCMTTCSTHNFGATSLAKSRIFITRHEGHALTKMYEPDEIIFLAFACQQCDTPYCMNSCQVNAITRNPETNAMEINYDRCIGCRMCMINCPFGAIRYDSVTKKVFKCELCQGDPMCVKYCPVEALKYLPKDEAQLSKINAIARKAVDLQRGAIQEMKK